MERHTRGAATQGRVTTAPQATARTRPPAEQQRQYRAGHRAENRSPVLV